MVYRSNAITQLTTDLVNALYPNGAVFAISMPSLQSFVYIMLAEDTTKWRRTKDDQEQYVVLKLMGQILLWLEHSHFERPVSEHVYVSAWSSIFNTLLASDGLRVIPQVMISICYDGFFIARSLSAIKQLLIRHSFFCFTVESWALKPQSVFGS
jgi:hypothetical protein